MSVEYTPAQVSEYLSDCLDAVEDYVRTFVRLPESAVPAVCAWIAHTYLIDDNGFPACVTPRLGFTSRKPGGGKSTALATVTRLSRNGQRIMLPSKAGWMNLIERNHATICLDEMDKTFPKESSRIDIQAAINAGYEPDGGTIAHGNREVPSHAIVAFAGIGPVLECNQGLAPLWHRTIKVEMEPVFGVRFPEYDIELHARGTAYLRTVLESAMGMATLVYGQGLRALTPPVLTDGDARRDQIWRVLRRIGMAAGPKWWTKINESCADMESGRSGAAPVMSQKQRIMGDVRAVTRGESLIGSLDLIERLRALEGAPWAFLWPSKGGESTTGHARELAALLEPHGLLPVKRALPLPGGLGTLKQAAYELTAHRNCELCTDESDSGTDDPRPEWMIPTGTDSGNGEESTEQDALFVFNPPAPSGRPAPPLIQFKQPT